MCKAFIVVCAAVLIAAPAASGSKHMLVGINDEADTLYGNPDVTFPILRRLHVQVLRVNLYWGGRFGVALERPLDPTNPRDPAYDWTLYDRTVNYASQYGIKMLFSIYGTPGWANRHKGLNRPPIRFRDLQRFATAAARRYSGTFRGLDGRKLPRVRMWLAWNEPNNPIFLYPQYRKVKGRWRIQSARAYARICNAVYSGIHGTRIKGEKVGCGVTAPRGNDLPGSFRASVSPLIFLRACKKDGMRRFDVYAHHPYYGSKSETPSTKPQGHAVTLGNISDLIRTVTQLYGNKRIWITEYGYQTNPPDTLFGVSWARQALYLKQAFGIARANPRIDMMLWFLLKDDPSLNGWQSGLITIGGKKKPAFAAFQSLRR